jgi:outer membrane lipoprotein SlyB
MNKLLIASTLALCALQLPGCAWRSYADHVYTDADAQRAHSITMATVTAVRVVTIERAPTGVGGAAGANVGMALGSFAAKGQGSFVGSVLASVAGDLAGQAIESRVARLPGLEISMRLDNGQQMSLVQAADEPFRKGDRVRVLSAEGKSRVSR